MHQGPTLSVVMANFNHASFLPACLEGILSQSFPASEVIVVDDGSTDDSVEIIRSYAKKYPAIQLVVNESNKGTFFSFNRGLSLASGDYIYPAGADDKVLPGFFEKSMTLLARYPSAGLCCSDPVFLDAETDVSNETRLCLSGAPAYFSPKELAEIIRRRNMPVIATTTTILKASAFRSIGGLPPDLKWISDGFAALVAGFRFGICYVPEPLTVYRWVRSSASASTHSQRHVDIAAAFRVLKTDEYEDVRPFFRDSAVYAFYGFQSLRAAVRERGNWEFMNGALIVNALRWEVWRQLASITPLRFKALYRSARSKTAERLVAASKSDSK